MGRRFLVVAGIVAGTGFLAAAATAGARVAWPAPSAAGAGGSLLRISLPGIGGRVDAIHVVDAAGAAVPVRLAAGDIWPLRKLPQGERLAVQVTVRRPGWAGWLVGAKATKTFDVTTPTLHVRSRVLHVRAGDPVAVRLDTGAAVVSVDGTVRGRAGAVVPIGVANHDVGRAGSVEVAAAPRIWEKLSTPVRVSWFPAGVSRAVVASPAPGTRLEATQRLTLSFSSPVGETLPRLQPGTPGRWQVIDDHTIAFEPAGTGFPLGGSVHVVLPKTLRAVVPATGRVAGTLTWPVADGSALRLQQLLAQLHYLPLRWQPAAAAPERTPAAEVQAALSPPAGSFVWRYPHTPAGLRALWVPGRPNKLTQAALMRFEDVRGLPTTGLPDPAVWRALFADAIAGRLNTQGYTYVRVHETVPQTLGVWHNGRVVLTSPGNTGIPQAPTATGTYPVFEHIPVGTMSGTNPDGSHYNDPGVRWISYFHGVDAIHAFYRASYGTPQSLGCVELPLDAAAQAWPYTPVGTLVTVEP
ncbi:MAG: L,D-transpeptidase family protein [Gaiellaceae bacterium]